MAKLKCRLFCFLFIFLYIYILSPCFINGEEIFIKNGGYFLNLPEEWRLIDSSNSSVISFADATGSAVLQVFSFKGDYFKEASDIYNYIKTTLKAEGEGAPFIFSGKDSIFSDLSFNAGKHNARGYLVFINGEDYDFAFLSFSEVNNYEKNHDFLLSCLDSFSPDEEGKHLPGPVSQFYYASPGGNPEQVSLSVDGKTIKTSVDKKEIEATQILVEREARILASYMNDNDDNNNNNDDKFIKAWKRYYRIIYKDNYYRLKGLFDLLMNVYESGCESENENENENKIVKCFLSWIQKLSYKRTGTLADLTSPLMCAYTMSGDCDSRALLFVILLHYMGIDSVLLVSTEYNHSAVGINIQEPGAIIKVNGKNYIFAEVTEEVDIGLVPKKMADPSAWIPIKF